MRELILCRHCWVEAELHHQGQPLSLTCIHLRIDTADVCASLHMPLSSLLSLTADGGTLRYAAQPGASTVLAADPAVALHLPADQRFLYRDFEPDLMSGLSGLRDEPGDR